MKIAVKDGDVLLWQLTPEQYNTIKSWNLMRWIRAEQALKGKASIDLLDKLTGLGKLPPSIEQLRQNLYRTARLINAQRSAENPEPLLPYPVTQNLFRHQIRAANMALITFGFNPEKGSDEMTSQNGKGFGLLFEMG